MLLGKVDELVKQLEASKEREETALLARREAEALCIAQSEHLEAQHQERIGAAQQEQRLVQLEQEFMNIAQESEAIWNGQCPSLSRIS